MEDGSDWLFRPVVAGKCSAESLFNGVLTLEHIKLLNEALDVNAENERRYMAAVKRKP